MRLDTCVKYIITPITQWCGYQLRNSESKVKEIIGKNFLT